VGLDFSIIRENWVYFFIGRYPNGPLGGVALTLWLAVASLVLSFFGGLFLGLLAVSRRRWIRLPSSAVINAVRGMPLLMVIFWMYFLMPALLGRTVPESRTVIVALSLFTSAYMSQIVVAGIQGIPKGQTEAALSTGLHPAQAMFYVVLPQALRNMIPSFVNQFVSMIKDTSLAFIVGVDEIFMFIAVVYFVLCYAFTALSRRLEKRLAWRKAI
jgi:polar amino acid transport system permease protein